MPQIINAIPGAGWFAYLARVVLTFMFWSGGLAKPIIFDHRTWLGAGALAVFTVLTIPLAHDFRAMEEPFKTMEFHVVMEHVTVIGALMVVAYASLCKS